jgi:hypothetical protein
MATFTERPDLASDLISDIEADFRRERSAKGSEPHVSDLIYCLRRAWHKRHGWTEPPKDQDSSLTLMLGHALHAVIARSAKPGREVNVPVATDYAIGEADGVLDAFGVEDAKTTRKSANNSPTPLTDPVYVEQIASYIAMLWRMGRRVPARAIIHVLHLVGKYRPPFPILKSWEILLSDQEIMRWEAELQRRRKVVDSDAPPSGEHYEWECQYCPLAPQNGGSCPEREGSGRPAGFFILDPKEELSNVA